MRLQSCNSATRFFCTTRPFAADPRETTINTWNGVSRVAGTPRRRMESTRMRVEGDKPDTPGSRTALVCGWCKKVLRESSDTDALTSHGICRRCASVLEGQYNAGRVGAAAGDGEDVAGFLEERMNELMCRLYESRQMLLEVQTRVHADTEVLGRVRQALSAVRRQEQLLVEIQRRLESSP